MSNEPSFIREPFPKTLAPSPEADAERLARELLAAHQGDPKWLAAFLAAFTAGVSRSRQAQAVDPPHLQPLATLLEVWGLSQAEVARLLGVSRQAIGKWRTQGIPPERAKVLADLSASTDLLRRHLKRDRIAAVVRRPIPAQGNVSLLELVARGQSRQVLSLCREMFEFARAQGDHA